MQMALALLCGALALGTAWGCSLSGPKAVSSEVVQDREVLEFAQRIETFYNAILDIPLDVRITYDSSNLRTFFANDADFAAYYASLAAQLRRAQFRNATLDQVSIVEFSFNSEGVARVDLKLIGRHERALRLGKLQLSRRDIWERLDGSWLVTPDKI